MSHRRSGFTLLELLIVIAIIAVLCALLLPAVMMAQKQARIAVTRNQIQSLKAALAAYAADTGRLPRRPGPTPSGDALFKNDIAWCYAALQNNRLTAVGGGPNAPYLERKPENAAQATATDIDNNAFMSVNPAEWTGAMWLSPLAPGEGDQLNDTSFQLQHLPGTPGELVFVDIWGNPLVYREWASIPRNVKDGLSVRRTFLIVQGGTIESTVDRPHDPNGFDLISCGPNGIFEYGGGDDIVSWQGAR